MHCRSKNRAENAGLFSVTEFTAGVHSSRLCWTWKQPEGYPVAPSVAPSRNTHRKCTERGVNAISSVLAAQCYPWDNSNFGWTNTNCLLADFRGRVSCVRWVHQSVVPGAPGQADWSSEHHEHKCTETFTDWNHVYSWLRGSAELWFGQFRASLVSVGEHSSQVKMLGQGTFVYI